MGMRQLLRSLSEEARELLRMVGDVVSDGAIKHRMYYYAYGGCERGFRQFAVSDDGTDNECCKADERVARSLLFWVRLSVHSHILLSDR
jgi:uncharacterized ParB-like nuclease family protein